MSSLFLMEREMAPWVQEALQETENSRLLRHARQSAIRRLSRLWCWSLWQMGRLLAVMGRWFQQRGQPATVPLNGQMNGGMLSRSE
jgi:hypothetical protein